MKSCFNIENAFLISCNNENKFLNIEKLYELIIYF